MGNEMQLSAAEQAKQLLQIEGEHSLFELAELLRQFRNESHPDKFQDDGLKGKAEERFKTAQSLLDEINRQLEAERFSRPPSQISAYKPLYDAAKAQADIDRLKQELEQTKAELLAEKQNSEILNRQLQEKEDTRLSTEIQYLQSIYKPSTRNFAPLGIGIILSGALAVIVQMENVSATLQKYAPFDRRYISTILFICILFFLFLILRKLWEGISVQRKSDEICSPRSAEEFLS